VASPRSSNGVNRGIHNPVSGGNWVITGGVLPESVSTSHVPPPPLMNARISPMLPRWYMMSRPIWMLSPGGSLPTGQLPA
jgi:hypothetical protein